MLHAAHVETLKEGQEDILAMLVINFKEPVKEFFGKKMKEPTDRIIIGLGWEDGTKHIMIMKIGELISEKRGEMDCLIFGADAWMVRKDKKEGYDPETEPRPSEHPDREETLLTSAMTPDMKKMYTISQTHKMVKDEVKFEKPIVLDEEGQFYIVEKLLGFYGN